jgi:hypothetical protein
MVSEAPVVRVCVSDITVCMPYRHVYRQHKLIRPLCLKNNTFLKGLPDNCRKLSLLSCKIHHVFVTGITRGRHFLGMFRTLIAQHLNFALSNTRL